MLAVLVVALGSTVQGTVGFGQALIATPLLLLIDVRLVPGPATVAGILLSVLVATRERRQPWEPGLPWAIAGLVPGTLLAAVALVTLSSPALAVLAAIMILAGVGASVAGVRVRPDEHSLSVAGALSGFMGTTAAVTGPPVALVYQRLPGPALRATMARFFLAASVLTIAVLIPAGKLDGRAALSGAVMAPGALLGFGCSRLLVGHVDAGRTRLAVLAVSAVSALAVLLKVLL